MLVTPAGDTQSSEHIWPTSCLEVATEQQAEITIGVAYFCDPRRAIRRRYPLVLRAHVHFTSLLAWSMRGSHKLVVRPD